MFKEKQITPEVKGHGGTLVKTLCASQHCSLFLVFEDRFLYNNILNQTLNSLSTRSVILAVSCVEMSYISEISYLVHILRGVLTARWQRLSLSLKVENYITEPSLYYITHNFIIKPS